jgi:hypothetical protein
VILANILKLYARIVNSTLKIIFGSLYSGEERAIQKHKKPLAELLFLIWFSKNKK